MSDGLTAGQQLKPPSRQEHDDDDDVDDDDDDINLNQVGAIKFEIHCPICPEKFFFLYLTIF